MIGLVLALIWFIGYLVIKLLAGGLISQLTLATVFIPVVHFLYQWYLITTMVYFSVLVLFFLLMLFGVSLVGFIQGGTIGAIVGAALGGTASTLLVVASVMRRILFVSGSYLLTQAVVVNNNVTQWDILNLILGLGLIFIAITWRRIIKRK
ncbi:MAG: hypothetical protein WCW02_04640 [Candidatus Buchananbacteria bacterium]